MDFYTLVAVIVVSFFTYCSISVITSNKHRIKKERQDSSNPFS